MQSNHIKFNEEEHSYTNTLGEVYISATQLLGLSEEPLSTPLQKFQVRYPQAFKVARSTGYGNKFRQETMLCGIYALVSATGKMYIGSSKNVYKRLGDHLCRLGNQKHPNRILQNYVNKNGISNISCYMLTSCSVTERLVIEQVCIDHYLPQFNLRRIATNNDGYQFTPEHRRKIAVALTGKKHSPKTIERLRTCRLGSKVSEAALVNMKLGNRSYETKSKRIIATSIVTGLSITFFSIKDCVRELNVDRAAIRKVLTNEYKQAKGYTYKLGTV